MARGHYVSIALWLLASGCSRPESGNHQPPASSEAAIHPPPVPHPPSSHGGTEMSLRVVGAEPARPLTRDAVDGRDWAAAATIEVVDPPRSIAKVEYLDGSEPLGERSEPPWAIDVKLTRDGRHTLAAVARDAAGKEVARASQTLLVGPPTDDSCGAMLTALGLDWKPAKATKGVTDPVAVAPVIAGVTFVSWRPKAKPIPLLMACKLAVRLRELALLVKEHGVDQVRHMGIYNYRKMRNPKCQKAGNCKLSQHAFATALDIHSVRQNGQEKVATVEKDWKIDKTRDVCPGKPKNPKDELLHQLACGMFGQRVFSVILTPNYNANHRNHFHVDLTETWEGIRGEDLGIDPDVEGLGD